MIRILLMTLAALAASPARSAEFTEVLPERSAVTFTFKQMGVAVDGKFRRFTAQIAFDPAKPEAGRAQIEIDLRSIDAGSAEADEEARSKGWFNTAKHPSARFVSTSVKPVGGNRYEIAGKLTIKDTTRDLSMPVAFTAKDGAGQFEGTFQIKRLDYKIGEGVWSDLETVANEVQVRFRIAVAIAAAKK